MVELFLLILFIIIVVPSLLSGLIIFAAVSYGISTLFKIKLISAIVILILAFVLVL